MKKQPGLWFGVTAVLLVLSLVLAGCVTAPQDVSPAPITAPALSAGPDPAQVSVPVVSAPASSPEATSSPAPDKPGAEGINVHGNWTIEVRNPDGTLAERREFENALTTNGSTFLANYLGRLRTISSWSIKTASPSGQQPFLDNSGTPSDAVIAEDNGFFQGSYTYLFKTLTVTVPTSGDNANKLVLNGTATAARDGQINTVYTEPWGMIVGTTTTYSIYLTSKTLSSPISLSTGQQINITVVISFS